MTTLHVPPLANVEQMIAECIDALPCGTILEAGREEVVNACAGPMMLLIEAVRLAGDHGPDTEAILIMCIRKLYAQAETARRVDHFAALVAKLNQHRNNTQEH